MRSEILTWVVYLAAGATLTIPFQSDADGFQYLGSRDIDFIESEIVEIEGLDKGESCRFLLTDTSSARDSSNRRLHVYRAIDYEE